MDSSSMGNFQIFIYVREALMKLEQIFNAVYKGGIELPNKLLCLDPGHTTGYSVFERGKLTEAGQFRTVEADDSINWEPIVELLQKVQPTHIVMEDYRVYSHKLDRHSFSRVPTLRVIGALDFLCWEKSIPVYYQMATQAKGFITDEKLKKWGLYDQGQRHSRDSMRHGLYYLITTKPKEKK